MKEEQVEVRSVGTTDGVDRDYRAGFVRKDPITGKEVFIEILKLGDDLPVFMKKISGQFAGFKNVKK